MKKLILISLLILSFSDTKAQKSKQEIYYLADTINVSKKDRVLEISGISGYDQSFVFFCKCVKPYYNYPEFIYLVDKNKNKPTVVLSKPNYPYISFKNLMDLVAKKTFNFEDDYQLYITEVLPGNKYLTKKVLFNYKPEPAVNVEKLPK